MYRYPIKPNQVRDWLKVYALSANKTISLFDTYKVVGLDIFIHNRGASALTFRIDDDESVITLLAGDSFTLNNIKFNKIAVTSTVAYDMALAGVMLKELR